MFIGPPKFQHRYVGRR